MILSELQHIFVLKSFDTSNACEFVADLFGTSTMSSEKNEPSISGVLTAPAAVPLQDQESVEGRAVFSVETMSAGVAVSTIFLANDGRTIPMSAVFPDLEYALDQIEALRKIVIQQFGRVAQIGFQSLAAEQQDK